MFSALLFIMKTNIRAKLKAFVHLCNRAALQLHGEVSSVVQGPP